MVYGRGNFISSRDVKSEQEYFCVYVYTFVQFGHQQTSDLCDLKFPATITAPSGCT